MNAPRIAGMSDWYTASQLRNFRDGIRGDAMMTPMAKTFSDKDIENLAEYYSSLCACKEPITPGAAGGSETKSP